MQIDEIPRVREILEKAEKELSKVYACSGRLMGMVEMYQNLMADSDFANRLDMLIDRNPISDDTVVEIQEVLLLRIVDTMDMNQRYTIVLPAI